MLKEDYFGNWDYFRSTYDPTNPVDWYIKLDCFKVSHIYFEDYFESGSHAHMNFYYTLENINGTELDPDMYSTYEGGFVDGLAKIVPNIPNFYFGVVIQF